jgi:hypothetical protein
VVRRPAQVVVDAHPLPRVTPATAEVLNKIRRAGEGLVRELKRAEVERTELGFDAGPQLLQSRLGVLVGFAPLAAHAGGRLCELFLLRSAARLARAVLVRASTPSSSTQATEAPCSTMLRRIGKTENTVSPLRTSSEHRNLVSAYERPQIGGSDQPLHGGDRRLRASR